MANVTWDKPAEEKFKLMVGNIPIFLRGIAQKKVFDKAENIAWSQARSEVTEKDLVDAFFVETPFGFHGPMKIDMEEFGIDYTKYGYKR